MPPFAPGPASQPAVILLSGGLDSATALAVARSEGFAAYCLSFDYGQRHRVELEAAVQVAAQLGAREHRVIKLDPSGFRGSALTDGAKQVPKGRDLAAMAAEIPVTYVPARNTIFLSFALGWAEVLEASDLFIGVNALDYSGYPDCRPEYIAAFEKLARLATKAGVEGRPFHIHTPLIRLSKAEIIRLGAKLGVDFSLTHSCYDPGPPTLPSPARGEGNSDPGPPTLPSPARGEENSDPGLRSRACGQCDSCLLRKKGFAEAGLADPARYV